MKDDLGPLPRIHEREAATKAAERALSQAIDDTIKAHGLTGGEALRVVNAAFAGWLGDLARTWVRQERHGNTDTPGGFAP